MSGATRVYQTRLTGRTAAILRYATKRSLVIMDEYVEQQVGDDSDSRIGRGTTLQAGMAIAYATLDYILGNIGCRTLFATHYHELETMLKEKREKDGTERVRRGVEYWCTDVDEAVGRAIGGLGRANHRTGRCRTRTA